MDIGLHHRGVHPHLAPLHHPVVLRDLHHPFVDLFDHLRPQSHAPATHGLGIGRLGAAHAGEVAVHQIGAHFALEHDIAPVADVLEDQQPQHHFSRSALSAATAALGMPPRQRFVHRSYDLFIRQHPVGVFHPAFAKIAHFFGDQSVAKAELRSAHLNHAVLPERLRCGSGRSKS